MKAIEAVSESLDHCLGAAMLTNVSNHLQARPRFAGSLSVKTDGSSGTKGTALAGIPAGISNFLQARPKGCWISAVCPHSLHCGSVPCIGAEPPCEDSAALQLPAHKCILQQLRGRPPQGIRSS